MTAFNLQLPVRPLVCIVFDTMNSVKYFADVSDDYDEIVQFVVAEISTLPGATIDRAEYRASIGTLIFYIDW